MMNAQPLVTSPPKNVHFGEPCESGYSTTTSSEEGTLQRGFTQPRVQGFESDSFLRNPKFLRMVSNGHGSMEEARTKKVTSRHYKKRNKNNYLDRPISPSSQSSPYSSTSSLTQQYVHQEGVDSGNYPANNLRIKMPQKQPRQEVMQSGDVGGLHNAMISRSHENLVDRSSMDEMSSSFEDLGVTGKQGYDVAEDDVINAAAIQQFQQSMQEVKSYQTDKYIYPHPTTTGNSRFDMDYYKVGEGQHNPYYDPLDITDIRHGQTKKRVMISTSPSSSSGGGSPQKPSPIRGILKNPKQAQTHSQNSTSSTPVRKNSLQSAQQFSKSEENLTSMRRITPPTLPQPITPGSRKSAFVVVKPRVVNRPTLPEGPVMAVHPPVQQMIMQNGFEPHLDHHAPAYPHTCHHGVSDQALQFQLTPRNSTQVPYPSMMEYRTITDQLSSPRERSIHADRLWGGQDGKPPLGSPRDGNIIFIPAQIDEHGIARPMTQQSPRSYHGNGHQHDNGHHDHSHINNYRDHSRHNGTSQGPTDHINSRHDNDHSDYRQGPNDRIHSNNHRDIAKSDSPLPPAEMLSNEAVRLRLFLDKIDPLDLKDRLETMLKLKDPGSIHAMTKLFPGSEFTADAAHCVRCHKDFNPRDPGRCILPHPERMVAKISQDEIGADFVCGCCNAGFRLIKMDFYEESTNALLTGHCYSGTHTTDPESVDYRIDGGVAKSCEEFGCVEFYV